MKFSAEFLTKALAGSLHEARELTPVLRKCASAGAAKSKAMVHADDIEQELWLFLKKNVSRLDETYNIEPYLIETARKMALAYNRKFWFYGSDASEEQREVGISDLDGNEVLTQEEAIDVLIEKTAQQQAMEYLMQTSPALRAVVGTEAESEEEAEMRKKAAELKKAKELTPEQKELRKLRLDAGLSQLEMANRLGCKLPTYQAYEYGKTKSVSEDVMEMARRIKGNPQFSYVNEIYGRKQMKTIANEWCDRLTIKRGHVSELARVLGIDKSTVSRWYSSKMVVKPEPDKLAMYERRVNLEEEWLKKRQVERRKVH